MKKILLIVSLWLLHACSPQEMAALNALAAASGPPSGSTYGAPMRQGKGFYTSEYTQGFNKVCVYDRVGNVDTLVVSATSICPLSY